MVKIKSVAFLVCSAVAALVASGCSPPTPTDRNSCEPGGGWIAKGEFLAFPTESTGWAALRGDAPWAAGAEGLLGPCKDTLDGLVQAGMVDEKTVFSAGSVWAAPKRAPVPTISEWFNRFSMAASVKLIADDGLGYIQCALKGVSEAKVTPLTKRTEVCAAFGYHQDGVGFGSGLLQGLWPFASKAEVVTDTYNYGYIPGRILFLFMVLMVIAHIKNN
jgi:hypothetical protein